MVSDKTIIICAILLSVAVGFSTLESLFDTMAYNLFPYVDPIDENAIALYTYQSALQLDMLQNIGNDDYFIEKIKDIDVYDAFIEKYPDATLTFSGMLNDDETIMYGLHHASYDKPRSITSIYFQTSLNTGITTFYHSCTIENYFSQNLYSDIIPTLYWINAGLCEDQIKKVSTYLGDKIIPIGGEPSVNISNSFITLTDLVSVGHDLYGNIILVGAEITSDGILVHVDATNAIYPYSSQLLLDEITDILSGNVPLELLIIE